MGQKLRSQFIIGSLCRGTGKTVLSAVLLRMLSRRGMRVRPFVNGSDCVDAFVHRVACDVDSIHLDTWMCTHADLQRTYNQQGMQADVCLVDGKDGVFDGYRRTAGSDADMAMLLGIPMLLVVSARHMGWTVAPLISGFRTYQPKLRLAGVVFTQVSSNSHFTLLKEACLSAGVPCLGYLLADNDFHLDLRHAAPTLTLHGELNTLIDNMADMAEQTIDLDALLACTKCEVPCSCIVSDETDGLQGNLRIAVARDHAFSFLYADTLRRLSHMGTVEFFSPVFGNDLPPADLVYFPGGYVELYARQLSRRHKFLQQLRQFASDGGFVWAEGGGVLLLSQSMQTWEGGSRYQMAGILPMDFTTHQVRLIQGCRMKGEVHGYEHRYFQSVQPIQPEWIMQNPKGTDTDAFLIRTNHLLVSSAHLNIVPQVVG